MVILEKEIEINLTSRVINHYESLGYVIPRVPHKQNKNRFHVAEGTRITIKIEDLSKGSAIYLTRICDGCGDICKPMRYYNILKCRETSNGKDFCQSCGNINGWNKKLSSNPTPLVRSLSYNFPNSKRVAIRKRK